MRQSEAKDAFVEAVLPFTVRVVGTLLPQQPRSPIRSAGPRPPVVEPG